MPTPPPPAPPVADAETTTPRPVLCWHAERDETSVKDSVAEAATFLDAPADAVVKAIHDGRALGGWFVDWAVAGRPPG